MYVLVSGRSGTNKTSCVSLIRDIIKELPNEKDEVKVFDSGTMDGLMSTLEANNGCVLCAVDEFNTFLDGIDRNSNGNVERSRYLSLWSGCNWSKKTKHGGLCEIENPRFQLTGFNQNYFLLNMILNTNHFDGFLARFLIATPKEEYIKLGEKIAASSKDVDLKDIQEVFNKIYKTFFKNGFIFELSSEALDLFTDYHDNDVLSFRMGDVFGDTKSMIKSKSLGQVLRISSIQCALRLALNTDGDSIDISKFLIIKEDMVRAINLVTYSTECLFSLLDASKGKGKKRVFEMPSPDAMDEDFLITHKQKIQKLFNEESNEIQVSKITRNHICPQIGGKTNSEDVRKFLQGLEKHGLGELKKKENSEKTVFILADKENIQSEGTINLMKKLNLI